MGALHRGHLRLAEEARRRSGYTVVSIFVNPTQFGPGEDLARYPRDLEGDVRQCASVGVDLVFAPDAAEMYPPGDATRVRVEGLAETLCGPSRPGHFEGVATVVAKLFALASPCTAIFGRKDYQRLRIVDQLTRPSFRRHRDRRAVKSAIRTGAPARETHTFRRRRMGAGHSEGTFAPAQRLQRATPSGHAT
jgi:pantoate--beta-alanine ligase